MGVVMVYSGKVRAYADVSCSLYTQTCVLKAARSGEDARCVRKFVRTSRMQKPETFKLTMRIYVCPWRIEACDGKLREITVRATRSAIALPLSNFLTACTLCPVSRNKLELELQYKYLQIEKLFAICQYKLHRQMS